MNVYIVYKAAHAGRLSLLLYKLQNMTKKKYSK